MSRQRKRVCRCGAIIRHKALKCYACAKRQYRNKNPEKATYQTLRANAKRRGKPFKLTFEEFKAFAVEVGYMQKKGIEKKSYHIDRIDETKGYVPGNLQVLTNCENVKKYVHYVQTNPDGTKTFKVHTNRMDEDDHVNVPF